MTVAPDIAVNKHIAELVELIREADGVYIAHSDKDKYFITVNHDFDMDFVMSTLSDNHLVFTTEEHYITLGDIRNSKKYSEAGVGMWKISNLVVRFFKVELI
jgi:hypothetical protein